MQQNGHSAQRQRNSRFRGTGREHSLELVGEGEVSVIASSGVAGRLAAGGDR